MKPRKRYVGGISAGLIFFIFIMSSGHVALTYDSGSGSAYIFGGENASAFSISSVLLFTEGVTSRAFNADTSAFHTYLAELTLYPLTGDYTIPESSDHIRVICRSSDGEFSVTLSDTLLEVASHEGWSSPAIYRHREKIRWEYLYSLMSEPINTPS